MVTVFLADGFEEIEAICPIDILRRGGVEGRTCSITSSKTVLGAHQIPFVADTVLSALSEEEDLILLPGGMPGTTNLLNSSVVNDFIDYCNSNNLLLCAICAAPMILGKKGLLKNYLKIALDVSEDKSKSLKKNSKELYNKIQISNRQVKMIQSNCKNKDCMYIEIKDTNKLPIICTNGITIKYKNKTNNNQSDIII